MSLDSVNRRTALLQLGLLTLILVLSSVSASAQQSSVLVTTPTSSQTPNASAQINSNNRDKSSAAKVFGGDRYRIGAGDVLNILVIGKPQFSREGVVVEDDGTILMPYINEGIRASCKTEKELARDIAALIQPYMVNPVKVAVTIKDYQALQVSVLGAVRSPARFQLKRPMRLLDLLTYVNGPSEAAGRTIQIVHTQSLPNCEKPGAAETRTDAESADQEEFHGLEFYTLKDTLLGEDQANPYVRNGDIISIAQADQIYVIGNVVRPTSIALRDPVTVSHAIAMAGGTAQDAKKDQVRIIRQEPGGVIKKEIVVDLRAIEKHKAEDVVLLANDIVDVPTAGGKRLFHSLVGAVIPSVAQLPVRVIP